MLQNAAELAAVQEDRDLKVTVTNNTGHKLPTGYPEGRRVWINVKFCDDTMTLISESCAHDADTGILSHDAEAKIYEIEPGLDEVTAPLVGVDRRPSFHFALNNAVFKDNRIPPRGFTNAAYADFGGAHVAYSYPDGQGLCDLWNNNGKSPPEVMVQTQLTLAPPVPGDYDGDADLDDYVHFEACLLGPGGGLGAGCDSFDADDSGVVDLLDFAEFEVSFTGG